MSEFHYVRTLGTEGGVSAVEGPAVGLDLETILKDGLPPFKVALEIMAAMCEIIDIADQDGEAHGDVLPRYVFLDETGAVSIEGYGSKRTKTMAPEHVPKGTTTDLWNLGYVGFRLLAPRDLPAPMPEEAQAYDDAVIDAILAINFEGLPEDMVGDMQWFVAKLMSFEKEDRPGAVDVWRTFIAFADATPGPRLDEWATAALGGGGDRRDKAAAAAPPQPPKPGAAPPTGEEEDLGGPVMGSGPLKQGAVSFDGGKASKGTATAFWSKEDMKKALDNDEEDGPPSRKQPKGSATAFWTKDQMDAMKENKEGAPRPKRKENANRPATMMMKPPKREDEEPDLDRPAQNKAPPKKAPPPPPTNQAGQGGQGGFGGAGAAKGPAQNAAVAQQPMLPPPGADAPPAEGGGGPPVALIAGVVIVLLLVLGGGAFLLLGGGAAGLVVMNNNAAEAERLRLEEEERKKEEEEEQRLKEERERKKEEARLKKEAEAAKKAEEEAAKGGKGSKTSKSGTTTKPTTGTTGTKTTTGTTGTKTTTGTTTTKTTTGGSTRPKGTGTTTAATTTPSGPVAFTVRSAARGKLSCSDGQAPSFDGMVRVEFDPYTLPVNCMVTIDGKRGVLTVDKGGSATCNVSGSEVVCQ